MFYANDRVLVIGTQHHLPMRLNARALQLACRYVGRDDVIFVEHGSQLCMNRFDFAVARQVCSVTGAQVWDVESMDRASELTRRIHQHQGSGRILQGFGHLTAAFLTGNIAHLAKMRRILLPKEARHLHAQRERAWVVSIEGMRCIMIVGAMHVPALSWRLEQPLRLEMTATEGLESDCVVPAARDIEDWKEWADQDLEEWEESHGQSRG